MEFQVQGSVLVDGEWVSRSADVYQIMSRAQQQEDVDMDHVATTKPRKLPEMGILSKTVIGSPLYNFILPANIRHKDLDDVVFIGQDFVQLKEICDYGHLRHVATKSDLKGKILAAKAFGDPRKVHVNTSEKSPLLKRSSLHRSRRSMTGEQANTLPLEVIVLTLTTRTLMFLWAKDGPHGSTTFAQKTIRLPTAASRFNRPGQFLAIEPRCHAIAVAAAEGCFMLYKTKPMDVWRRDMQAGNDDVPIIEETQYPIEGRIMHMDFLSPGTNDDDPHVVLVFIVVHEGKTKIETHDWDLRNSLDIMPRKSRSILDFDNRSPSLLIPLSRSADFLLVQSEYISVCKGVLAGPPTTLKTPIPDQFLKALHPGSNKGTALWVQWDRAPRNPDFDKEAIYLVREDGAVLYVELGGIADPLEISHAGSWPCPVDTAFACLKADGSEFAQSYPDVLVAGGFGSDGHLCKVGSWPHEYTDQVPYSETNMFSLIESLPNWAPITDMAVARLENMPLPYDRTRASIFVANGKTPFGQISQLRRGLRALVDETFSGLKGTTGLWLVDHGSTPFERDGNLMQQDHATFLVTVPGETLVLRASRAQHERSHSQSSSFGNSTDNVVWETEQPAHDGLIRTAETLAACPVNGKFAVQVTNNEIRVVQRPQLALVSNVTFPNSLLGAATKPDFPYIVVAYYEETKPTIRTMPIGDDGSIQTSNQGTLLTSDPTCIHILTSENLGPFVFVGIGDIGFSLFKCNEQGSLLPMYHSAQSRHLHHRYESAALLTVHGHEKIVCGTRTGLLLCLDLADIQTAMNASSPPISKTPSFIRMGTSPVYITPNKTDHSMAFLACGADFCRIHLSARDLEVHIDSIWLDFPQSPTYSQGALNAIDQIPFTKDPDPEERELGGYILAVIGDQMVYARLDYDIKQSCQTATSPPEEAKIVPRKLSSIGTPTKIMIADDLAHHMIVVTSELKEERTSNLKYRTMLSNIKIISLLRDEANADHAIKDEFISGTPKTKLEKTEVPLKHYERVYSMVRWVFLGSEDRQHALIVVGTGITESPGKETGRRLILNVGKSGLTVKDKKRFEKPVRCIAVYDNQHIVSIIGDTMQIEQIERTEAARWKPRGQIQLPSPGVHMTVSENFIHVSTSHDSHLCFHITKIPDPEDETTFRISQVSSDSSQRLSLRHLTFNYPSVDNLRPDLQQATIVLLTDKNASVTGLLQPQGPSNKNATVAMFEACLPRSVIRIQRGDIRPPWRRLQNPSRTTCQPLGVIDDDFLGACTDGTIYSFATLDIQALHLLRFIQNLIEEKRKRDPALQFSTVKHMRTHIFNLLQNGAEGSQDADIRARDVDPEVHDRGSVIPRFRHVDGDLLIRFFEEGGELKKMVREGCDADVERLFLEKARWLSEMMEERDTVFNLVEEWLKELLMPLL